jgi:hypothetical protein
VAIARHRRRKDLPRDHIAIGFDRISEWIEAFEFRVDADLLRSRGGRKRREAEDEGAESHGMCHIMPDCGSVRWQGSRSLVPSDP